jgi:hypothetical protein
VHVTLSRTPSMTVGQGGAHWAAVLGAGWSSLTRAALPRWSLPSPAAGRSSPDHAIHNCGVSTTAAVLGAGLNSLVHVNLPRRSLLACTMAAGQSSPACAIRDSGVELIGHCPRGGAQLAHARRFDAVELAIHSSGLINRENTDMIMD